MIYTGNATTGTFTATPVTGAAGTSGNVTINVGSATRFEDHGFRHTDGRNGADFDDYGL